MSSPCRSVSQKHTDYKIYLSIIPCPAWEVSPRRPGCICVRSPRRNSFPQTRTGSLQSSIPRWSSVFQLLACLQNPQLTEVQGISRILASRIVTLLSESLVPFLCRFIPPAFERNLFGLPEVSTRDILLKMYPPGIQHTPKETSEHMGALLFLKA